MRVVTIATTIHHKLSEEDIKSLEKQKINGLEVKVYGLKQANIHEIVKFVFEGLDVVSLARDSLLWEGFMLSAKQAFKIAKSKGYPENVHYWIRDIDGEYLVNIAFMANGVEDIEKSISNLSKEMPHILKKYKPEQGEIVWISYDLKTEKWNIKVI